MKRSEVIQQLMNEGFSERTLVNFSDKQLATLSSRILSEQQTTAAVSNKGTTVNVNSANPRFRDVMSKLKTQPDIKNINVTEGGVPGLKAKEVKEGGVPGLKAKEVKECEGAMPGMKAKKEVKESGVPGLTAKKTGKDLKHGTAETEMKEAAGAMPGLTVKGATATPTTKSTPKKETKEEEVSEKKPSAGLSKEKKSEVVKKAKAGGDIGKKGKGFEKVAAKAAKEYGSKEKGEKVAAASMWKNIKREGKEMNEWVEDVVKKHYHPFTSKGDIMEMISAKMEEMNEEGKGNKLPGFLTAKAIKSSGVDVETAPAEPKTKPTTKPGTKPGTKPTPKTPYKPGPGTNPHPKSMKEEEEEISEAPKKNNIPVVKPGAKI